MNLQFVGNAPGSAYTYGDRGDNYSAMQSYNEAITNYTEAIRLLPDYAYAYRGQRSLTKNIRTGSFLNLLKLARSRESN